ncbi:MAG TPA: hypothetical protein PKY82_22150 [Pyrinomonadaceae bacterium]|nr:hypothetical protein [Pyrinomonadaceae bacterium]
MDNQFQNLSFDGEHPPREQFLMFIDGELSPKESQKWEAHLAACWECRVQVGKAEETIADIIEFENVVVKDYVSQSLGNTTDFNSKLRNLAQQNQKPSFRTRLSSFWFIKEIDSRLSAFWFNNQFGKFATASLACLLIFVIIFQLLPKTVSASELLNKSNSAYTNRILNVSQPVIYQKLKITTNGKSAILDVWNDVDGLRIKRKVAPDDETKEVLQQFETAFGKSSAEIIKPLSSESYQNWSSRLTKKQEGVTRTKTDKDEEAFELSTKITGDQENGKIIQANLIVRESDWHPVNSSITIKTADGNQVFEVSEMTFRIIKGVSMKKDFFNNDTEISTGANSAIGTN